MSRLPAAAAREAPWRDALERLQGQLDAEFRVLVCGGPQIRAVVVAGLTDADGPLRLVPGPGCPVTSLSPDLMALLCGLAARSDLLCCAPEWVVRHPEFAGREGAEAVVPLEAPMEALTLVVRHPDRHVVLYAAGGEADARSLALVAYQARELCVDRFSMLLDLPLASAAAGPLLAAAEPPFHAVVLPQIGSLLPDGRVRALSEEWGLPVALADGTVASVLEAVALAAGAARNVTPVRRSAGPKGHPSRWLLERVLQVGQGSEGGSQAPVAGFLGFAPAFRFLDTRRVLGLPEPAPSAAAAPGGADALAPCRNWAGSEAELCPICRPAAMPHAVGRRR